MKLLERLSELRELRRDIDQMKMAYCEAKYGDRPIPLQHPDVLKQQCNALVTEFNLQRPWYALPEGPIR